jgi:hypothetical protein
LKLLVPAVFIFLFAFKASAQLEYGFNGGVALYPVSGQGNFYDPNDTPHKEYGFTAGFNLKYNISKSVFFLTHTNFSAYQSHFHVANPREEGVLFKGYYLLANIKQSVSLNKTFFQQHPKRMYNLKSFVGASLNSRNFSKGRQNQSEEFSYRSTVTTDGILYPEFFAGIGLVKKIKRRGVLYYTLSYKLLPFEKLESYVDYSVFGRPLREKTFMEKHKYVLFNIIYLFEKKKKGNNWSICK